MFQNAEEGTGLDSTQARYIGAEAAKVTSSALQIQDRYWEKVATTQDNGQRVTQYKVFASVVMPEADFKRAILDAARKREGKGGLSADFAAKVNSSMGQIHSVRRQTRRDFQGVEVMNWKLVIGGLIAAGVATAGIVYKQYSAPKVSEYSAAIKAVHSWEEWQKVSVDFTVRGVEHDPTSLIHGLSDADREKAVNCSLDKTVADLKENCTSYAEFLKGPRQ